MPTQTLRRPRPRVTDVDLRLLRVFRAVVECGGFAAAETELDVARSTISTHIASLEARLGLRLCERGRGGFALTEPGRLVYDESVKLLGALAEFRSRVDAAHRNLTGELNVGIVDNLLTLPEVRLAEALRSFRDAAPEVHVSLRVMAADEIERGLAAGSVHVGVHAPHRRRPDLVYRTLTAETQHLYCARGHPLHGRPDTGVDERAIEACDFVGRSYLDEARARDRPWRVAPAATANNLEAILVLILTGRYLGLLPVQYAEPWVGAGDIRAVRPDLVTVRKEFALVHARGRSPAPVVRAFLDAFAPLHAPAGG